MDPAELLREHEGRLIAEYRASHPPKTIDGEDLQSDDPATAEHWVGVYTELVDFVRSLPRPLSLEDPTQSPAGARQAAPVLRAVELQARVFELHLDYWTDRMDRLRREPGPG